MVLAFDAVAFILGLGYVMGLRSSTVLVAGGVLSNLVLVPLIWMIGQHLPDAGVSRRRLPIAEMTAAQIFRGYVRFIGVGAIATAGHLRHHQVAAHRRRLVRHCGARVPPRRDAAASAPIATSR